MTSAYSFQDVHATFAGPGGVFSLGAGAGVAEEGITLKREGDQNKMVTGADGKVMHNLIVSTSGTIEITLLRTSPANAQLQAAYDIQRAVTALWGVSVITVSQTGLGDLHVCTQCAFKKFPDSVYATEGKTLVWTFDVGLTTSRLGGA